MKDADNMSDFKILCREIITKMDVFDHAHSIEKNTTLDELLNKIYNLVDEILTEHEGINKNES